MGGGGEKGGGELGKTGSAGKKKTWVDAFVRGFKSVTGVGGNDAGGSQNPQKLNFRVPGTRGRAKAKRVRGGQGGPEPVHEGLHQELVGA